MGKYYKLYLNNNNRTILYNSNDYELEGVVLKTRTVLKDKKTFFGTKQVEVEEEYFDKAIVIGEESNGRIVDLVIGDSCATYELSQSYEKTETGFNVPVEKRNCNTPKLSYYKKEEITAKEVVEILEQYSKEDIERYREKISQIAKLSANNYITKINQLEQLELDNLDAEEYIKNFKARCRK